MNEFLLLSGPLVGLVKRKHPTIKAAFGSVVNFSEIVLFWAWLDLSVVWWGGGRREAPPEPSEDWRDAVCSSRAFLSRWGPTGNRERNSKFSPQKLVEKIETPLSLQRKFSQLIGLPNLSNSSRNLSFNWKDFQMRMNLLSLTLVTKIGSFQPTNDNRHSALFLFPWWNIYFLFNALIKVIIFLGNKLCSWDDKDGGLVWC